METHLKKKDSPIPDSVVCSLTLESASRMKKDFISILAVGDLMIGGRVLPFIKKKTIHYPFRALQPIIASADISIANLEAPFTLSDESFDKKYTFHVPPQYGEGLKTAGFDVVTLANNHIMDFGPDGLFSTLRILDSLEIGHCGAGRNLEEAEKGFIQEIEGFHIGFLAFSLTYPSEFWATSKRAGTAYPQEERLQRAIQLMKMETDFIIISFHWGGESMMQPKPYQRFYGHRSIEWGANLVIGHHPHVLQGLELYQGGLIAYSLGNFVFGSYSHKVQDSIILKIQLEKSGVWRAGVIPICVNNFKVHFQPRLLEGESKDQVIHSLNTISRDLNKQKNILTPSGEVIMNHSSVE